MVQDRVARVHPRSLRHQAYRLAHLVRSRIWLQVLLGMWFGLVVGSMLGPSAGLVAPETSAVAGNWLALPGQLFLAALQMIVVPLVVASVARGMAASEDMDQLRSVGLRVTGYFVVTTVVAAILGIGLAELIRPGDYVDAEVLRQAAAPAGSAPQALAMPGLAGLPERLVTLVPQNPLGAMVQREMLQVVIFSMVVGIALVTMPVAQSRPLLELLGSVQSVCLTVVGWAMRIAPLAVFGLMAQLGTKTGIGTLLGLAVYAATVLLGLALLLAMYLAVIGYVAGRRPLEFLAGAREVLLLAFSTSSSAAVMPLSIRTAEDRLGVRPSIVQFVIPLGATINMNGTAVYQAVATVFLAQLFGIELTLAQQGLVVTIAVASAIGAPATPGVGIVILATILGAVGVPLEGVALILGIDRLLDMCRTAINVAGDLVACVVMDAWIGGASGAAAQQAEAVEREAARAEGGVDVIVDPAPARD